MRIKSEKIKQIIAELERNEFRALGANTVLATGKYINTHTPDSPELNQRYIYVVADGYINECPDVVAFLTEFYQNIELKMSYEQYQIVEGVNNMRLLEILKLYQLAYGNEIAAFGGAIEYQDENVIQDAVDGYEWKDIANLEVPESVETFEDLVEWFDEWGKEAKVRMIKYAGGVGQEPQEKSLTLHRLLKLYHAYPEGSVKFRDEAGELHDIDELDLSGEWDNTLQRRSFLALLLFFEQPGLEIWAKV